MCVCECLGDVQQRDSMLRSTKRDGWLLGRVFFVILGHQRGHWQSRLFQRF